MLYWIPYVFPKRSENLCYSPWSKVSDSRLCLYFRYNFNRVKLRRVHRIKEESEHFYMSLKQRRLGRNDSVILLLDE